MMFMAQFIVRHVLSFLFLLNVVWASPLALTRKDVPDPAVLTPNASTVWVTGQTETVVWLAHILMHSIDLAKMSSVGIPQISLLRLPINWEPSCLDL